MRLPSPPPYKLPPSLSEQAETWLKAQVNPPLPPPPETREQILAAMVASRSLGEGCPKWTKPTPPPMPAPPPEETTSFVSREQSPPIDRSEEYTVPGTYSSQARPKDWLGNSER